FHCVALAIVEELLSTLKRRMQNQCHPAFIRSEVSIARTERQTVGFARDRADFNLNRHVEVAHHAPDYGYLCGIFLSEERDIRLDDVEQLGDNSGHAAKVTRARFPAETVA